MNDNGNVTPSKSSVYAAVYSGVEVFEFMCREVPVMRRVADSYLNATQILKVANFTKPRRTKILEKEVLHVQHEKIQGGYGKYQGTWIPMEQGRALAVRYGVEEAILPILTFDPTKEPIAAKPVTQKGNSDLNKDGNNSATRASLRTKRPSIILPVADGVSTKVEDAPALQANVPQSPHIGNGRRVRGHDGTGFADANTSQESHVNSSNHHYYKPVKQEDIDRGGAPPSPIPIGSRHHRDLITSEQRQREVLMHIFIDDAKSTLEVLRSTSPPFQLELDFVLDDQNHTALHWAAALARLNVLRALLTAGADPNSTNSGGETPLIRSVMVTNNFDNQTFVQVFSLLQDSVRHVDHDNRTLLHHIACTAGVRGRSLAAKHYISVVSNYLETHPSTNDQAFVDLQDKTGDTALHIACRTSCKTVAQYLLRLGCRRDIPNTAGMKAEDLCKDYPKLYRLLTIETADSTDVTMESSDEEFEDVDEDVATPSPIADELDYAYNLEIRNRVLANGAGAQLITVVQDIVEDAQREFRVHVKQTEEEIKITRDEMNAAADQLNQARKEQDHLQMATQQLEEIQSRVQALQRQLERMVKSRLSFLESATSLDDAVTPEDLARELALLRRRLDYSSHAKKRLSEETEQSKIVAEERMKKLKRLICICSQLPEEKVDDVMEDLVDGLTPE
ncbi:hypothetical protein SeMB42_g05643 [Synchytrium endobioticum]|uniref:HTH APSES-type domain-containing protein n=1 Tax=Synchytrium endobioticum TaxID=286115 RepID=A0A507CQ57_9FUNG|nr:hypothetical protein SeMB42_g05643 [Synchytrium endobioticum]TPX46466.1 hypothetical protein SeLEV6574_g03215 [Synchytrium endobioticum]